MTEDQRHKFAREVASVWFSEVEEFGLADQMHILACVAAHCARVQASRASNINNTLAIQVAKTQLSVEMDKHIRSAERPPAPPRYR